MISLVSMNGPSVTMGLPSLNRTVVAVSGPFSCSPPTILPSRLYSSNHLSAAFMPAASWSGGMFSNRVWSSMVPTKSRTYVTFNLLYKHRRTATPEFDRLRAGEFRFLLAQQRHDADRAVRTQD